MANVIWKYDLGNDGIIDIKIPKSGEVLCAKNQHDRICIWVKVNSENDVENRQFVVYGTGHPIDLPNLCYIDSVMFDKHVIVFVFNR